MLNYRANIVIFHEIAPLSARSSKKEDAKRGTGAREMAKTDRKTGAFAAVALGICCSIRPPTAKPPRCAGAREAGGARGGPNGGTERHNRRAAPARVGSTPFRQKKEEHTAQTLGTFSTYRGAFRRWPPPRPPPHADARSKGGETDEEALARAHNTEFLFFAFTHLQ